MKINWFILLSIPCFSLPRGPLFVHGEGEVQALPRSLEVQASDRSILNWDSFDVAADEAVAFALPSAESAILNRVTGGAQSEIFGRISSNGQVVFLNPNGILVGQEAVIDTARWYASTLDLQDKAFLESQEWRFAGNSEAAVEMSGEIIAEKICVLGKTIVCRGKMKGHQISLGDKESTSNLFVSSRISTPPKGETLLLSAGSASFTGEVYSPGGFVEVSGLQHLDFRGAVDTDKTGTLLLDPNDITIVMAPGTTNPMPLAPFYTGSPVVASTILNTDLTGLLATNSVVIQTSNSVSGGSGNITVDLGAPVSWGSGTSLTLHAANSILINDTIQAMAAPSVITLVADAGDVVLTSTAGMPIPGAYIETDGVYPPGSNAIIIQALNGSLTIISALDRTSYVTTTGSGDIRIAAASLNFTAADTMTLNANAGILGGQSDLYVTVSGAVNFISGDAPMNVQANANGVTGLSAGIVGGNLYFSAGSLNFDSTRAMSGGNSAGSFTAYGASLTTGNVTGSVAGDVLFKGGFPSADGSGISSLFEGEINLAIGGNATFISSSGPSQFSCGTGIQTLLSLGFGSSRDVNVSIAGDFLAISGGGMDSGSGIGGIGDIAVAVGGNATFQATTGTALSGRALFSTGGSVQFAALGDVSFLGNAATPLASDISAFLNASIAAGGNLILDTASATAGNDLSMAANGSITASNGTILQAGGALSLAAQNGSIFATNATSFQSVGQLLAIAGRNIEVMNSTAASTADRLIFVVDNLFPTKPLIGPGAFIMDPSALSAPLGISIYTARQQFNSITNSTLNGATFVPGTLFVNTPQEIWCTYYPAGVTTLPFTIFYKDCVNIIAYSGSLDATELLRDLHSYDEYTGWMERFSLSGDETAYEPYYLRRRQLMFTNPKSWTVILNGQ